MRQSRFPTSGVRPLGLGLVLALVMALAPPTLSPASAATTGTIQRVSVAADGAERNRLPTGSTTGCSSLNVGKCTKQTVNQDGTRVVFASRAPNLAEGDRNKASDIFLWTRDPVTDAVTLERITNAVNGGDANGESETPAISPNGEWIAFESKATNLVASDPNGPLSDIYLYQVSTGTMRLVSVASDGTPGNLQSFGPSVADNGTVSFTSFANNLVPVGRTSQFQNIFVHRDPAGAAPTTEIASAGPGWSPGAGPSKEPTISADGTRVAFTSAANFTGTEDEAGDDDIFIYTLGAPGTQGTHTRITADAKAFHPTISPDGDQVAFVAELIDNDLRKDVYVAPTGGGSPTLVSECCPAGRPDRPAVVPSISSDGKVTFESPARFTSDVRSAQVWMHQGPVPASQNPATLDLADAHAQFGSISSDGNWVTFSTEATNLVSDDFNNSEDVYLKNLTTGELRRVSEGPDGLEASGFQNQPTAPPAISVDGTVVAFSSDSSNLLGPGADTNGVSDIFVRADGTTTRISNAPDGSEANGGSFRPAMSADGRYVVFESIASNLVAGDSNESADVFLHDRQTGETRRVSQSAVGEQPFPSRKPAISANGRYVAFESQGTFATVLAKDLSVYRYHVATGEIDMASQPKPVPGSPPRSPNRPSYSASVANDGTVAFISRARNITGVEETEPNNAHDVFIQRTNGDIRKITFNNNGEPTDGNSYEPVISADGTGVAFATDATNLPVAGADANPDTDVYLADLTTNQIIPVSGAGGVTPGGPSSAPSINHDGSLVAFMSEAENLVAGDSNVVSDVFLADPFTGGISRISQQPGVAPAQGQGNLSSYYPVLGEDKIVAFHSSANNLVDGDGNNAYDTFIYGLDETTIPDCIPNCEPGQTPDNPITGGYRFVASDGGIFTFGDVGFHGSMGDTALNRPIVGMAATPNNAGYWLVASDGGIFSFGNAAFHGSTGDLDLNSPIVSMAASPSGQGYWFVAADGGIFSFGDAEFFGSMGGQPLNSPIVGMAATPTGEGYWLVAADGGIFSFGDAAFHGSTGDLELNRPIVGMDRTSSGQGYRFVASDGGIFSFGDAEFHGSMGGTPLNQPIVGMASSRIGDGYWLVASDGGIFSFGDAAFFGSTGDLQLNSPIVGMAS